MDGESKLLLGGDGQKENLDGFHTICHHDPKEMQATPLPAKPLLYTEAAHSFLLSFSFLVIHIKKKIQRCVK